MHQVYSLTHSPFLQLTNNHTLNLITNFLNQQDLQELKTAFSDHPNSRIYKIANTKLVFKQYINASDRSYYYSMFESQKFLQLENQLITHLALETNHQYEQFPNNIDQTIKSFTSELPGNLNQQFCSQLKKLVVDPGIIMPRLHRETATTHINTPFQSFLLSLNDKNGNQFFVLEEAFENIKNLCQQHDDKYFISFMKAENEIIQAVRHCPQIIKQNNMKCYLIKDNLIHNLIVGLFALADLKLSILQHYLTQLTDPFHLLVELLTRFSQFQSFIISIEDNFKFAFQTYGENYNQVKGRTSHKFSFWKPSISKWIGKMEKFHSLTNSVYCQLLSDKIRDETFSVFNEQQQLQFINIFCQYQQQILCKQEVYEIAESDPCDLNIIIGNYQQYLMDISINQSKVHWCGHTQQIVDHPYLAYEQLFISQEVSIVKQAINNRNIEEFVQTMSKVLMKNLKPRTVYRLFKQIEKQFCSVRFETDELEKADRQISLGNSLKGKQEQGILKQSVITDSSQSSSMISEDVFDCLQYESDEEEILVQ